MSIWKKEVTDVELYEYALQIAMLAHKGQTDKLGESYIDHPLRVSLTFSDYKLKTVAVLHDVAEDTDIEIRDFSGDILTALDLLTHNKYESYHKYIRKLGNNRIATLVKLSDLEDNTDPDRLSKISKIDLKTAQRLAKKYLWAIIYLTDIAYNQKWKDK